MNNKLFNVKGFITVITGSARGIGLELAKGFYDYGSKVIRVDLRLKKEKNYHFDDYKINLTKNLSVDKFLKKIEKKYGKIDVLINNAGIVKQQYKHDLYNEKILKEIMSVNFIAAYSLSHKICKIMSKNNKGSIINITSITAERGFAGNPSYQISKASLKQYTKSLANDWGSKNIRANNVCPGYIKTPMTIKNYKVKKLKKEKIDRMIIKRFGNPSDLLGPCVFLASDASSYITGSDIFVDGGWLAKGI